MTITTTRRHALGVAACALSALTTTSTTCATPRLALDPVFAMIETHRAAYATYLKTFNAIVAANGGDFPDLYDEVDLHRTIDQVGLDLLEVEPTTVAGVAALLQYVHEHETTHPDSWPVDLEDDDMPARAAWCGWSFEQVLIRRVGAALAKIAA